MQGQQQKQANLGIRFQYETKPNFEFLQRTFKAGKQHILSNNLWYRESLLQVHTGDNVWLSSFDKNLGEYL